MALDVRNDMFMAVKSIALDGAMNSRASILNEVEILKIVRILIESTEGFLF